MCSVTLSIKPFRLIFITADSGDAATVAHAGVDFVMVDLEMLGKQARQGNLGTVISGHSIADIAAVAKAVAGTGARVMVRSNPLHEGSNAEIDAAIAEGAQRLMLPMFRHSDEIEAFLDIVDERVPVTLLLETGAALARLPRILLLKREFDLHLGLNDLHLDLGLDFMFELFSGGIVKHVADLCHAAGRDLGIGGVARPEGTGELRPELILDAHLRLGSSGVILSRDWRAGLRDGSFASSVAALRDHVSAPLQSSPNEMDDIIGDIVRAIRSERSKLGSA